MTIKDNQLTLTKCKCLFFFGMGAIMASYILLIFNGILPSSYDVLVYNYKPKRAKIYCYINTYRRNHERQAIHSHRTWSKRCDHHEFASFGNHSEIPMMRTNLSDKEGRSHLWIKMVTVLPYIYKYLNDYDYFLKADDDTYVIVENLRELLQTHSSPDTPIMFGYKWPARILHGYVSGGPGYVMSRETLKRLVEQSLGKLIRCPTTDGDKEDVKISTCAEAVGVKTKVPYDELGIELFQPYSMLDYISVLLNKVPRVNWNELNPRRFYVNGHPVRLSSRAIGYHYVNADLKYIIEFLTYFHTKPYTD